MKIRGRRFLAAAVLGLTAGLLMTGPVNAATPAMPTHGHHHHDRWHDRWHDHDGWHDGCWWEDRFNDCDDD